jgi:hypothetical protein
MLRFRCIVLLDLVYCLLSNDIVYIIALNCDLTLILLSIVIFYNFIDL